MTGENVSNNPTSSNADTDKWVRRGSFCAWMVALFVVVPQEIFRWQALPPQFQTPVGWFIGMNPDFSFAAVFLLVAPLCWFLRGGVRIGRQQRDPLQTFLAWGSQSSEPQANSRTWKLRACGLALALLSLIVNLWVGRDLRQLPPAYHDEYSYLFQAQSYLDGRVSSPVHPAGEVFDQIHVLNHGRFTSRYFPGTGIWMAPFLALRDPYLGHSVAGALCTWWIFWAGFEMGGSALALLAGTLTACSPGIALFGNLLLAHHPGLIGLSLFLYRFLRWMRIRKLGDLWIAGFGLGFAMLCRPMTAAGFALPFGIYFVAELFRKIKANPQLVCTSLISMGAPLLLGFAILGYFNLQSTGNWRLSAYQAYTDHYTPRHVYGFNNVLRGEQALGNRVLPISTRYYDTWAENLTPALATRNFAERWLAAWRWTIGIIPGLLLCIAALSVLLRNSTPSRLVCCSILSLHAVHLPYWFVGIMHWHYVFETAILWPLLMGAGTTVLFKTWRNESRPWLGLWWVGLVFVTLLTAYVPCEPCWSSRVEAARSELLFPKVRYARFRRLLQQSIPQTPALVLIEHDPADRSLDYVNNHPRLEGQILLGRYDPQSMNFERLRELFPDRSLYLYHVKQDRLELIL